MYKCRHFDIEELVPRAVILLLGRDSAWVVFDDRALRTLDGLRDKFGATYVNDWQIGGNMDSRGYRCPNDKDGADFSQHKLGNAFDCTFKTAKVETVRAYILAHPDEFPWITGIEKGVSWLHFDTGNRTRITVFGK
jgi:hypothetical protein